MYTREQAKQLRKNFWIKFGYRCKIVPELKHKRKKWMLYDTDIPNVELKFKISRHEAWVMIELNQKNENKRLKAYSLLEQYKAIIEQDFCNGLTWELCYTRDSGEEVSRIFTKLEGVDIHNQNQWPDIYNFYIDNMLRLERNFTDIQDILKEQLS